MRRAHDPSGLQRPTLYEPNIDCMGPILAFLDRYVFKKPLLNSFPLYLCSCSQQMEKNHKSDGAYGTERH